MPIHHRFDDNPMASVTSHEETPRPLRADAERNRQRILDAARELFAEQGLGVTLNDVAHRAGVGVGTVYRRFPDKKVLIDNLFEQRLQELVALMDEAVADPDPWHGLSGFMKSALELQAADRGLRELITGMPDGLERVSRIRNQLLPRGVELARRAHEAGQLRPDIEPQDLPIIQLALSTIIDAARDVQPDLWRRYMGIMLRGISARPDELGALEPGPLAPEDVDKVMSALKLGRR
jgi:AcrR family transcriptional regulator